MEEEHLLEFYIQKQSQNSAPQVVVAKNCQQKRRNLPCDFFSILIIFYHMVQWLKVTNTQGQSYQEDDY